MILRRFRQHVKAENWFAVFIDFLVVVIGIFVGLQASEWNEYRNDRVEERQYLERLLDDMVASVQIQKSEIEKIVRGTATIEKILFAVRDGKLEQLSAEDINNVFTRIGASGRPLTRLGTIIELQAAGRLQIIKDIEIRNALSELQQSYTLTIDIMGNLQDNLTLTHNDLGHFFVIAPDYDSGDTRLSVVTLDFNSERNDKDLLSGLTSALKFNRILLLNLRRHNDTTRVVEALLHSAVEDTE